jgi:hypothetical protein
MPRTCLLFLGALVACQPPDRPQAGPLLEETASAAIRERDEIAIRLAVLSRVRGPLCILPLAFDPNVFRVQATTSLPYHPPIPQRHTANVIAALLADGPFLGAVLADTVRTDSPARFAMVAMSPLYRWEHSDTVMVAVVVRTDPLLVSVLPDSSGCVAHTWYLLVRDPGAWRVARVDRDRPSMLEIIS